MVVSKLLLVYTVRAISVLFSPTPIIRKSYAMHVAHTLGTEADGLPSKQ